MTDHPADLAASLADLGHPLDERSDHAALAAGWLSDPATTRGIARGLAELLRDDRPDRVVVWESPADAILGFLVAEELACTAVRARDADGLADVDGDIGTGDRLVLVTSRVDTTTPIQAVRALAAAHGATLVSTGTVTVAADLPAELSALRALVPTTEGDTDE